ncbi:GDYXXLXY domain-containing protein [Zhongshania guokunii]|uniref:GDYXXLXY domain-containing protein n=1 Tax=Zhongshania guokunii TaxID=641783 RepID=A0ABV3U5L7_9GAMM
MRKALIIALVVGQFGVLAYMAGQREWIRHRGENIYLRTAPVDPRDPMRGDYVQLSYGINNVDVSHYRGRKAASALSRGAALYAVLKAGSVDVYELDYLSDQAPVSGLFLRGRLNREMSAGQISVSYGIEQYFVEQGSGRAIETKQGGVDGVQVPLEVAVAVGGNGRAVLTGYRWSRLGIRLEQINPVAETSNTLTWDSATIAQRSPVIVLSLQNVSDTALKIADNDKHCGFYLQSLGDTGRNFSSADKSCSPYVLREADIINLEPGEVYRVELNMGQPRWYVLERGAIGSSAMVVNAANERFRLVYQTPLLLPGMESPALWQGRLVSPAFSVRGRVD